MKYSNLADMFVRQVKLLGDRPAVYYKEERKPYKSLSWKNFGARVQNIAYGLAACDVKPGEAVAIFAPTSHLWVAADFATICNGAFSVPIYPNSSAADIEYILNNSHASVVFVSSKLLLTRLLHEKDLLPRLKKIIYIPTLTEHGQDLPEHKDAPKDLVISLADAEKRGKELSEKKPNLIKERIAEIKIEDTATIIYTSGTTGTPKGVVLTHSNILSLLKDLPSILFLKPDDTYMSYLPLSHVFERICGEFYWLYGGCSCAFAESIESLARNLTEVEPSIMLVVPRILDRIYTKVRHNIEAASEPSRKLIEWAISVGKEVLHHKAENKLIGPVLQFKHLLAHNLVLRKIKDKIGRRFRFIVSGGAPATPDVIEFFNAIGIPVLEGYGLTETCAPTHANRMEKVKIGTVGPSLSSVKMKLAEDGEILVKGPTIFQEYFKNEKETEAAFSDGWFHTGDIGTLDKDGYLTITDRKKDLIVNAAGKNIAPQRIESILKTIPGISQAIVFGDKRKSLVALLTIDQQGMNEVVHGKGWNFKNLDELIAAKELQQYIKQEIKARSNDLAEYEQIRSFSILPEDLSIENGELTATLKVKRNIVAKKYAKLIDSLYGEDEPITTGKSQPQTKK